MKNICTLLFFFFCTSTGLFCQTEDASAGLADSARWTLGRDTLQVKGKTFSFDCSGVIYAISYKSGLDIQAEIANYGGNGVSRLYHLMKDRQLLTQTPSIGDLIFWDNSYDRNGNGISDDGLTHVGIVISISSDGLITFAHHNYSQGIVEAFMDPSDPGNRDRNSPMRARADGLTDQGGWSAGHLLRAYGHLPAMME